MISKDQCFHFGKIVRAHGVEGAVISALDVDPDEYYSTIKTVLIDLNNALVPFAIEQITIQNNTAILFFESVADAEGAALLAGHEMYLPLTELPVLAGNGFYFHEVTGFTIIDSAFGEVGSIAQVYDMPQQAMAQVFYGDKEVLIPLIQVFVDAIDREKKQLLMTLPDGLISLYIS